MTIGADGCKKGWVAAINHAHTIGIELFPDLSTLWKAYGEDCALLLIDMPIGLTDKGPDGRECDRLARRLLSPRRHSSIFTPPCRQALYAPPEQASEVNFEFTGKKLSRQTINIMPKMREVDQWIRKLPTGDRRCIRESHPEVLFTTLNDGLPLFHNKKTRAGQQERKQLLERFRPGISGVLEHGLSDFPRKHVLPDDLLDALVLGLAADIALKRPDDRRTLPAVPPQDREGLPMEIFYIYSAL